MRNVQAEFMVAAVALEDSTSLLKEALASDVHDGLLSTVIDNDLETYARRHISRVKSALISYEDALIHYQRAKQLAAPDTGQGQVHWLQLHQTPVKLDRRAA